MSDQSDWRDGFDNGQRRGELVPIYANPLEILEGEIVDDGPPREEPPAVPVDAPPGIDDGETHPWQRPLQRRPILPAALRKQHRRQAFRWYMARNTHIILFHAWRIPYYQYLCSIWAPRGTIRLLRRLTNWLTDADSQLFKKAAVALAVDKPTQLREAWVIYRGAENIAQPKIEARRIVLIVLTLMTMGGAAAAWWLAPWFEVRIALLALVDTIGGVAGRPADTPLISHAVVSPQYQKLTSDLVIKALKATGIPAFRQKDLEIEFAAPIVLDGPGWRADVHLPDGVIAGDVQERRDRMAGALRKPLGCVWPEGVSEEHPGYLVLWVGHQDVRKSKQPAWPLLTSGPVNVFEPQPWATDVRGRWIDTVLMFASVLIGAVPRMGKTFAIRELLLIAALDPRVQIHAYELKGTGDLSPSECIAHRYICGDTDKKIAALYTDLLELQHEMRRRVEVIADLPRDMCPENKVTPELADKRPLGLFPIVVGIDEVQRATQHPLYGERIIDLLEDLAKRGPAAGIVLMLATQRPDAGSIPKKISDVIVYRFCLRVLGHEANDMVLGTGAYRAGIRATMFSQSDKGIGIAVGEGDDPVIARPVFGLDAVVSETVARRARRYREQAGTLTGYCVGQGPTNLGRPTVDLLNDVKAVWHRAPIHPGRKPGDEGVWSEDLVRLLGKLRPDIYDGWTTDDLAKALGAIKPVGVKTVPINHRDADGKQINHRGVRLKALDAALAARAKDTGREAA